ncbi:MAG: DinB family protein [Chloroflexi bacterium]|nr:DinB family protein [Chloroflexota bacterium]
MQTLDLLDRLLEHDAWTTRRVLEFTNLLSDEQLDQEFEIGQRTIRETFRHIIGNIEIWTDLMSARPVRRASMERQAVLEFQRRFELAFSDFAQFARRLRDTQRLYDTYVDVLDEPPQRKTYAGTILHVITHDHMHRAEILHMLQRLGIQGLIEGDVLSWEATRG